MKRKTMTVWLATDEDGSQITYLKKPIRQNLHHCWAIKYATHDKYLYIGKNIFKQTWKDKPRKIEMILRDA